MKPSAVWIVWIKNRTLTDGPKTRTVEWYKNLVEWHKTTREVEMNGAIF